MKLIIKSGVIFLSSKLIFISNILSESKVNFELKEIPNFDLKEIKKDIPSTNDPFKSDTDNDYSLNPFENLSIKLIGLFKIENELNAMIKTYKGIKNYQVGDKIDRRAEIKKISIRDKEIIISDGMKNYSYKLSK